MCNQKDIIFLNSVLGKHAILVHFMKLCKIKEVENSFIFFCRFYVFSLIRVLPYVVVFLN